jgi:TfoX/Sxy family transcriptional regulator of competence genes
MATTRDFIDYVCGQITDAGVVRSQKMFGEYMVYVDEKPTLLVCDNTVFVKQLACVTQILEDAETGSPYNGAKEHYILDIDNSKKSTEVAKLVSQNTPLPKKKKK